MTGRTQYLAVALAVIAGAIALWFVRGLGSSLPLAGSPKYEDTARSFYHGLAALEVGLLDDARAQFARATELVPDEPAAWANLGLTHLRLGELDAAAAPIERALSLAPQSPEIVLLAGRMETARGRLDAGIARLRRAVELDPRGVRTRMALAEETERAGGEGADATALALVDEVTRLAPANLAVLVERTRLAARGTDVMRLRDAVASLAPAAEGWPEIAQQQLAALRAAADGGVLTEAARATLLLRNVLARVPAFIEGLGAVRTPAELVAEPFAQFLALAPVSARPDPHDAGLRFAPEALVDPLGMPVVAVTTAWLSDETTPSLLALDPLGARLLPEETRRFSSPTSGTSFPPGADGHVLVLDWNHDFRPDVAVVGNAGLRLWLQSDGGAFMLATAAASDGVFRCQCTGAWAADVEMDGDLDIVVGVLDAPPLVLRNNGDGTWREVRPFEGMTSVRTFAWADIDRDADPDAVFLDMSGALAVFANRQAGQFSRMASPAAPGRLAAVTVADIDADGVFDLVALGSNGELRRWQWSNGAWTFDAVATWEGMAAGAAGSEPPPYRLLAGDLDNNGGLDLVASGAGSSRIWLSDASRGWHALPEPLNGEAFSVGDLDADGRLDLVGVSAGRPTRFRSTGTKTYHWKVLRTRAQQNAGDQRINAFGVGGSVEARAGLLFQRLLLAGAPVHIGLGTRTTIDVARIVWPNGVPQAEFGVGVDDTIVAEQRLKGSCPWVFAWDGTRMRFVTDFLWRSPLGLRINAQDTAGVAQTEDWVRVDGARLVPRDGVYDLRITAELWETHFFDHVRLLVVDHPDGVEAFVDERFAPAAPPTLAVEGITGRHAVAAARDHRGGDVTALVAVADGASVVSFDKGAYQGIAREHWVELDLPSAVPATGRPVLVATGWIYPTDSSINVAVGQGAAEKPRGVALDVADSAGRWRTVVPDLGFPAGKNKTMLIDLGPVAGASRIRLRTNLEVSWDALSLGERTTAPLAWTAVPVATADLRHRGFSRTTSPRGAEPETPHYDELVGVSQRWRDLEGYHTRFGDVRELLRAVDDRYVIMNAGDELRLTFPALPAPPSGWRRDFVLVGDGWEKDGDYNTEFSQTVLPLPSHDNPAYRGTGHGGLEDDPVYRRHAGDWEQYHTRYVTPRGFVDGIRPR